MNDWEGKSDFDINTMVTGIVHNCEGWDCNGVEFYHCGADGNGYFSQPILDYCNNPSDSWSIILSNNINLLKYKDVDGDEWEAQAGVKFNAFGYDNSSCEFYYYDKNPLRAAMIVFLMINEGKNHEIR